MTNNIYRFGSFELDETARTLLRNGIVVAMAPKAVHTLLLLVQASGRVVPKSELLRSVWPDTHVEENALAQVIFTLRKQLAVDDAGESPIETVTRIGYRFRPPVIPERAANGQTTEEQAPPPDPNAAAAALDQTSRMPSIAPQAKPTKVPLWPGVAVIAVLALAGALFWFRPGHPRPQPQNSWTMNQVTENDSDHNVGAAAISPDGHTLAYTDTTGISLREMQTGRTHPLKGPTLSALRLLWFGDGSKLLLTGFEHLSDHPEIWVISTANAEPILLRRDANDGAPSPDGRSIAFTVGAGQAIRVAAADGTGERTLVQGSADRVFSAVFWSADGNRISYQQRVPSGIPATEIEQNYDWSYHSINLHTGHETAVVNNLPFDSAAETSSGQMYFLRSHPAKDLEHNGLWKVQTDPATGGFVNNPVRRFALGEERTNSLSVTNDGAQVMAVRQQLQPHIFLADLVQPGLTLKNIKRLTSTVSNDFPYSWNAASDAIYFESQRLGAKYHVFRQPIDSANAELLTVGATQQFFPTIMPDGKTLVYEQWTVDHGQKRRSIVRANAEGENPKVVWKEGVLDEWRCPVLSGTTCVLRETDGQRLFNFYELNLVSGKGRKLAYTAWEPTYLGDWALSPDGRVAAIPNHDPLSPSIRFVPLNNADAEKEVKLQEAATLSEIHWSIDARGFYVEAQIGLENQLQYIQLNGKARTLLHATGYTWGVPSKDGRKLAFADSTISRNVFMWH